MAVLVHQICFIMMMMLLKSEGGESIPYEYFLAESNNDRLSEFFLTEDDERIGNYNFMAYSHGLILDPCRDREPNCCFDRFGNPEYIRHEPPQKIGYVWAIGRTTRKAYRCAKPCFGMWEMVDNPNSLDDLSFDVIDSDVESVWVINHETGFLFAKNNYMAKSWRLVSGLFRNITASGADSVYALSNANGPSIYSCAKPCDGDWVHPVEVPGHPKAGATWKLPNQLDGKPFEWIDIDADKTHVWVLTKSGVLFTRQVRLGLGAVEWADVLVTNGTYGQWVESSGLFSTVAISTSRDVVWAVSMNGTEILACDTRPCDAASWVSLPSPNDQIIVDADADDTHVWIVTSSGQLYQRSIFLGDYKSPWIAVPPSNDKSQHSLDAWASIPEGGFSRITASAENAPYGVYSDYVVREDSEHCKFYTTSTKCESNAVSGCKWSPDRALCEYELVVEASRLPNRQTFVEDATCVLARTISDDGVLVLEAGYAIKKHYEEVVPEVVRDKECVDSHIRLALPSFRPACWDYNETIDGSASCENVTGVKQPYCIAVGFTSTAYINQCVNTSDANCGVFLEIHAPGDPYVISASRITSKFTSGYRTMIVNTSFVDFVDDEKVRVLCFGDYEMWWVQRFPDRRIVEMVKKFHVMQPTCDWNPSENRYEIFHTSSKT